MLRAGSAPGEKASRIIAMLLNVVRTDARIKITPQNR
jgi:hypothetical protein